MSKLLFIKANPKPTELSIGLSVGEVFLNAYKEANPNDVITEVNLFERFIPEVDGGMLAAWNELGEGKALTDLSSEQQKQLKAYNCILDEFLANDKYVFITPLWNFMIPSRLKSYIDALCVAGKTFRYTDNGSEGLVKNKKALHINSSGGLHQGGYADKYLRDILAFIGVVDMESLIVEGHAQMSEKAPDIIAKGKEKAREMGRVF